MEIVRLPAESVDLIAKIDRSEYVDYAYRLVDGELERYVVEWDVPTFRAEGSGPHSVQSQIETWRPVLASGGTLLGAFEGDELAGIAIAVPELEPGMAWLAFMHVSRTYRRRGAGSKLWNAAEEIAKAGGAGSMYVSAIPSGPAIDFYVSRGCRPAAKPHPELFAKEPEDIHLICTF
jgi:GNAT superfamily N-acetyltransferase